ncbi:MAG: circularly permuted type 2 ATP-grasp protein [Alphaproteobacteria bacterium]|nr:circularly permuted type 2 ATP-grasp protein [Alphaproteobacteria bacterium]
MHATDPDASGDNDLLAGYRPVDGIYDELIGPDGTPHAHWRPFLDGLKAMPEGELDQHWETALRLIRQHGVTYNVYGDPNGEQRPWELDTLPLLIPAHEWEMLERGLKQRARLMNALLADLYGPQTLLKDGVLPPALVYANPNFQLPCHGIAPSAGTFLHIYAADIARSPDGRWWVFNDRTQAPSGAGYSLENRVITAQCLADPFRDGRVRRLAHFFQALRENLRALARNDDPRIILLTPGPLNEAYFEHAFLARYLGYPLVEGADLTVRDNRVYLKTVGGLRPVDVILRRVDTEWCDPLELRPDSALGIAGLVEAARAGNVAIANALGSGLVECTALMSFLPGICDHLLGEQLILPHVATWWCGQEDAKAYVLDNLDRLVIGPTFETPTLVSTAPGQVYGGDLDDEARRALITRIQERGYDYVGQEAVTLSTAPTWEDGHLTARPMALRMFATALGDDYVVMPGGLTRISSGHSTRAVSMQRGSGSKDTWVLSNTPVDSFSLLSQADGDVVLRRAGDDVPSRAADNLFWLGRYAERTENAMRLLRSLLTRLAEDPVQDGDGNVVMQKLLFMLARPGDIDGLMRKRGRPLSPNQLEQRIQAYLFDPEQPGGIPQLVRTVNGAAALCRDRLSLDAWRTLDQLHTQVRSQRPRIWLDIGDASAVLNDMLRTMSAFAGLGMENTTRTLGWRFMDMGRRLERAVATVGLLRGLLAVGDPERFGYLDRMLELADSFMTYRSSYVSMPRLVPVLDLLLIDESNPRSVAFQLGALEDHVDRLPPVGATLDRSPEQRQLLSCLAAVRLADVHALARADARGRRLELDMLMARITGSLAELSETIGRHYFSHADLGRHADSITLNRIFEP